MMKKRFILAFFLLMLLLPLAGLAQEAEDITLQCDITATKGKYRTNVDRLRDRNFGKEYVSNKEKAPNVTL